ncbi:pyruvoyl-dependent arginine decarboxylase [Nocardia goodfellowii]|uniref:Pyruvoyl-dependent arginine decarboxylase AaxB n=1 Tax=Nocardia goodfellowii TaxID=882446 RepID=A0ABS4QN24_9NOCA|nr:pyruvoyl-dependent arginine decarboxylase [Nocardia goodfellowii]MBP2193105.1 arginine decarboxylase [Nocardia goodfellowii]
MASAGLAGEAPARAEERAGSEKLTIEVGPARGTGSTAKAAFNSALSALGVSGANLIRLSSVIPPHASVQRVARVDKQIPWGDKLYCVYAVEYASDPGSRAAAGVGWVLRDDDSGAGFFVEHVAETAEAVEELIRSSLRDMVHGRPERFGPVQLCTSEVRSDGTPTCALVLAAYDSASWQHGGE